MASIWTSAAQAAQQGFDESYYLGQKAALLTTQTGTTWTVDMVKASFANAGLQAYEHYQEYGFKEGLNPNAYFNNSYYDNSKAAATPGGTAAAFQTAWNNANGGSQTSTYFHYLQYGFNEAGVNPSATFSEAQYYVDKAALLTAQTGQTWTVAQVEAAFASAGLTPITHYMLYGGTPNEPTPQPVSGGTGTTYTLTTGMDNIPGTALNDTIMAGEVNNAQTLTAGDTINGAGGTNTINVSANNAHNYAGFTMQNVQTLNVTADGGPQVFDLSGTTGLTSINSVNSSAAVQADYVATLANVGITNATAAANMTVGYQDVTGASDTVGLTMTNSSAGTIRLGGQGTNTGIETVALHSSGTASTIAGLDSQITNLTFDGSANVKIGGTLDTVKVIDASSATGGLTATIGTANANAVTFTGGSGADTITFNPGSLTAADTVTGGAGSDTLVADRTGLFAAGAAGKVTQVETITMSDQLTAASTFKGGTWFADATTFNLDGGYAAGATASITTGVGANAGQAVKIAGGILGVNAGVLTITDTATSATNDQATLGIYKAAGAVANTVANVAYTTNELETLNLTSGSTTDTKASGTLNTLTVSGGLNKVATLNISGADNLNLTTAASAITTVAAGTALGDLNLLNVQYAVPTATTATGVTITTGSGADQVSGTIGKDTVNTGAGTDIVTGTQGADSITLGAGTDTIMYTALNQSNAANTDTVTDFASGTDRLDISGLGATAVAAGGLNQATFALAQGALTGGGVVSAVYQQDANTLWVDMDGNGTLDANDFRVVLSGTASLDANSLQFVPTPIVASVAPFNTLTGVGMVGNATVTNSSDTIQSTYANLNNAADVINGLGGYNTLEVTDPVTGALNLGTAYTTGIQNIQKVALDAGSTAAVTIMDGNIAVTSTGGVSTVNLGNGAQTFTASGLNVDTVVMNAGADSAGQIVHAGDGADIITLGHAGQHAYGEAGADTFNANIANGVLTGSIVDGGSGTDILALSGAGTVNLNGVVSSVETLNLADAASGAQVVTLSAGFNTLIFDDAGDSVTATASQFNALTNITGAGVGALTLSDSGSLSTAGITFASALATTTLAGGDDTLTTTVAKLGSLGTTVDAGAGTDTLVLTTAAIATTLDNTVNFETVRLGGAANALTPADTVVAAGQTLTIDATTATGALTFDGHNESNGHFVINTRGGVANALGDGQLSDTFNLSTSTGADTIHLNAAGTGSGTSTVDNLDKVDVVNHFEHSIDNIGTGVAGTGADATYAITVASTSGPTFIGDVATALATAGISLNAAATDAVLVTVSSGTYAGTYAIQDTDGSGTINNGDYCIKLQNTVGNFSATDFVA